MKTFTEPPTRRDLSGEFSEFETRADGTWQLGRVIDSQRSFCLTSPASATKTWREAVTALDVARERAAEMLGAPLIADLLDTAGSIVFLVF